MAEQDVVTQVETALAVCDKLKAQLNPLRHTKLSNAIAYLDNGVLPDDVGVVTWDQIRALLARVKAAEEKLVTKTWVVTELFNYANWQDVPQSVQQDRINADRRDLFRKRTTQ